MEKVAEFNPTTRTIKEYAVPCCSNVPYQSPGAGIYWLTLGKGGAVWFVEIYGHRIGELKPTNSTQNVNINVQNSVISVVGKPNASVRVPIRIEYSGIPPRNQSEMKLAMSGTSYNGTLVGASAQFSPEAFNVSGFGTVSSNLTLRDESLRQGIYDLTISANLTTSNVVYSQVIELNAQPSQTSYLIMYAAIIVATVSAIVILTLSRRSQRTQRR